MGINATFGCCRGREIYPGKTWKRAIPFSTDELPYHASDYCLKTAGIHLKDIDHVAYSFDPYLLPGDCAGQK